MPSYLLCTASLLPVATAEASSPEAASITEHPWSHQLYPPRSQCMLKHASQAQPASGANMHHPSCSLARPVSLLLLLQVREALQKFEERLWNIVRDFARLARVNPAQLVLALRVIELQEIVDTQLKDSAGTPLCAVTHCAG